MTGKWRFCGPAAALVLSLAATAWAQDTQSAAAGAGDNAAAGGGLDEASLARSARATKLIGSHVYAGDSDVGKINDLLIDREHGTVTAAVLSVGGVLGVGDKLVAIPIGQIKIDGEARFVITQSKQDLEKAPAFDVAKMK
jgi:sporulation protein YlmC with PRC-barrel domain